MGTQWRYPLDSNLQQQEILAEIISHALSIIETLDGKDRECVVAEYKEWLAADIDIDVMVIPEISQNKPG